MELWLGVRLTEDPWRVLGWDLTFEAASLLFQSPPCRVCQLPSEVRRCTCPFLSA